MQETTNSPAELFKHVSAEKAEFYRRIMDVFAAATRQYRLQLRPDEVLAEAQWPEGPPRTEEVNAALAQLADWGNLQSQPDTARVSNLNDFYRARFLYRLSLGGEAVEAALTVFFETLQHRAELQTVASGLGITGTTRMRKGELIEAIREKQGQSAPARGGGPPVPGWDVQNRARGRQWRKT